MYGRNRNGGLRGDEVHSERLERGTTLFGWVGDHFQEGVVARTECVRVWSEETSRRRVGDSTGISLEFFVKHIICEFDRGLRVYWDRKNGVKHNDRGQICTKSERSIEPFGSWRGFDSI